MEHIAQVGNPLPDTAQPAENADCKEPDMPQAFAEVHEIILHFSKSLQILIPPKFMQFLSEHMDKNWNGNLDFSKHLMDMDLLPKTKAVLALVYRDFICSSEERKELIRRDKREALLSGYEYDDFSLMDLI